jgi:hypothetical protein
MERRPERSVARVCGGGQGSRGKFDHLAGTSRPLGEVTSYTYGARRRSTDRRPPQRVLHVLMVTEAAKHIGADRHERTDARTTHRDGHLSTRPLELLVSLLTYSSWWVDDGLRMPREGPYWHSPPKGMGMSQTLSARPAWSPAGQGRQPGTPPARHTSRKGRAGSTSRQEVDTDLPGSVHPPRLRGHRRCRGHCPAHVLSILPFDERRRLGRLRRSTWRVGGLAPEVSRRRSVDDGDPARRRRVEHLRPGQ